MRIELVPADARDLELVQQAAASITGRFSAKQRRLSGGETVLGWFGWRKDKQLTSLRACSR